MQRRTPILIIVLIALSLLSLAACGSPPATLNDIPAYPGATELQPGESILGDTLAQNNQTDAALRGQLGVGGKTEQKGYSLPKDATWDQIRNFYDEELKSSGWATDSLVGGIMDQVNQGNDTVKTTLWKKGSQTVTIVMVTSPVDPEQKELVVSLSSQ